MGRLSYGVAGSCCRVFLTRCFVIQYRNCVTSGTSLLWGRFDETVSAEIYGCKNLFVKIQVCNFDLAKKLTIYDLS
jgi:hypothetical protein